MIHFVYSVPSSNNIVLGNLVRLQKLILRWAGRPLPTTWRKRARFSDNILRRAPYSITANLYRFLSERTDIRLYDLREPGGLRYRTNDIILGHPWMKGNTIIEESLLNPLPCRLKALIFPIHHAIPDINRYAEKIVKNADLVFGIMGEYWYDTINDSEFADWKSKLVRLDMAVDPKLFPRVKRSFNPPGRRGYLYIGRNSIEKGPDVLSKSFEGLKDYRRGWIGWGSNIQNITRISMSTELTPEYMSNIAGKYDFFINTSTSDANPATILEAMAWGFPVACTPQSGYYNMPSIVSLSTTDIEGNIQTLLDLQFMSEQTLFKLADRNRHLVETRYTWERFCSIVWRHLAPFI